MNKILKDHGLPVGVGVLTAAAAGGLAAWALQSGGALPVVVGAMGAVIGARIGLIASDAVSLWQTARLDKSFRP